MLDFKNYIITVVILLFCYTGVVHAGTPPPNDDCASAISITSDGNTAFDTANATNSAVPGASCAPLGSGIWYKYTATCTGFVTVNTCASDFDTVLVLYDGADCASLSELSCNDDFCGFAAGSQVVGSVVAGNDYLIRVGGYAGETGTGTLNVTCEGGSCEEAQIAVQDEVGNEDGNYRNHGKYVRAAAHEANQFDITEECHSCIVSQFARGIPIEEQEVCTDSGP